MIVNRASQFNDIRQEQRASRSLLLPQILYWHFRYFYAVVPLLAEMGADRLSRERWTVMALRYEDVSRFARKYGDVKAFAKEGAVTLLRTGDIDTVEFFEKDAVRFEYEGKSYAPGEFEKLVELKK